MMATNGQDDTLSALTNSIEQREKSTPVTVMQKMTASEHLQMYWKFFFEKGEKIPVSDLLQEQVDLSQFADKKSNVLKSSWLGHSSLLINIDRYTVLTDPVFERKVSPVGPTRFNKELPLDVDDIGRVDVVIISHDHYDHLNKFSVKKLAAKAGVFIVPLRVGERLRKWGIADDKIVELNWWEEFKVNETLSVTATPSRHFSGRGVFDRNKTLWASWVIQGENHKVFFSGDSGYFPGFKEIGQKYGPFDVAFMECGAYNEGWSQVHMFPEQTVQAFEDLGGRILQPIHWATFNLAFHPWYEPIERVTTEAWSRKVQISTPKIGQVVNYDDPLSAELWWRPAMEKSRRANVETAVAQASH